MLAALLLSGGALADRLGARRVFQLGLGGFVVASVGCGVVPTTVVLMITRVVQGVARRWWYRRRWLCCARRIRIRAFLLGAAVTMITVRHRHS